MMHDAVKTLKPYSLLDSFYNLQSNNILCIQFWILKFTFNVEFEPLLLYFSSLRTIIDSFKILI